MYLLIRTVPGVGIYFSSVHWMRSQLGGRKPTTTQVTKLSIIIYHHISSSFHNLKAGSQLQHRWLRHHISSFWLVRSLFNEFLLLLIMIIMMIINIYTTTIMMKTSTLKALLMGASARAIAAFTMIPFTVLKTRWVAQRISLSYQIMLKTRWVENIGWQLSLFPRYESGRFTYSGLGAGLGQILRTEGLTGLYRGLGPTLVRCNWFTKSRDEKCSFRWQGRSLLRPLPGFLRDAEAGDSIKDWCLP